jgi:hypothetical protein
METLENIITELPGFKISNSHFRIGSKVHISDFYYAKRFFQNGFFSSRIAFLLAKDIINFIEKENKLNDIKNTGLTIIGYEMYSELLISIVEKFLRKKWLLDDKKINHNLYEDVENLRLCKRNNILGNVVIVVPIASTFSTAIKIENQILRDQKEEKKGEPYILKPHLNVLYVSDGIPTNTISNIEKGFGWKEKSIETKSIVVEAIYSGEAEITRTQKFYLTLPTKWYSVDECPLCNPISVENKEIEKLENELPLYETDRTSVTPAIIFDFPKGRIIDVTDLKRKINLDIDTVTYGHHTRNNAHFLYSVNSESFLENNKEFVQNWLLEIRDTIEFKNTYKDTDRVIIISLCHFSNAAFVSLVNDFLFGSSANIIHYDPSNDYVQNFRIVYGQEMNDADRIFFVDDSLKSGAAFDGIYRFIQNTLDSPMEEKSNKGITGCFFLLNKSQPYTFNNLKSKLVDAKHIYSFANLHLHTSLKSYETSPLQIEEERYRKLVSNSFIDSLKVHFQKQTNKVALSVNNHKGITSEVKANRHLKMLIATHRIYQYFTVTPNPNLNGFYEFLNELLLKTEPPIKMVSSFPLVIDNLSEEDTKAYLKVLTQSPFTQYKPLKDQVFKWVVQLLIRHIKDVTEAITNGSFSFNLFDTLKFLVRRAGLLNSNILISNTLIEFLPNLYSVNGIPRIISDLTSMIGKKPTEPLTIFSTEESELAEEISKLKNFHIFYAAQIKELLLRNESRCLRLERVLKNIDIEINPSVKQIIRILREENSLIIKMFYEHISSQVGWNDSREAIDYTNDYIVSFLNRTSISGHHKFQILNSYFDITDQPPISTNKNLLNYLWVQHFLSTDKDRDISLTFKTGYIMKKLMQMFIDFAIPEPGAFFIVNDGQGNPFVAFNKNHDGNQEIEDGNFNSNDNKYLNKFFEGEDNSFNKQLNYKQSKTIIELKRNETGNWIDLFATNYPTVVTGLSRGFISSEYNRLILIRLNKRASDNPIDKTQGIIGFYYSSTSSEIIDINIIRYLLLLRPSLSLFIESHHETDEFREWQISELKQRTALLTGHGREMLIKLARTKDNEYKEIVYTLLMVQRFLIDKKEESSNLNYKNSAIKKIFEDFYQKNGSEINNAFFSELKKKAIEIFNFEEIENSEELDEPEMDIPENLSFRFDKKLLNMICFEILVNAKKNRWLFANETVATSNNNIYDKNKIWIKSRTDGNILTLILSNTGPKVPSKVMERINTKQNIKKYDNSSGIELINTLFKEFSLGDIRFDQEKITEELSKFMVLITLNQSPNGK